MPRQNAPATTSSSPCERLVREHGEQLVSSTAERRLIEDGAVVGAVVRTVSGEERVIRARSTLMATGKRMDVLARSFGSPPSLPLLGYVVGAALVATGVMAGVSVAHCYGGRHAELRAGARAAAPMPLQCISAAFAVAATSALVAARRGISRPFANQRSAVPGGVPNAADARRSSAPRWKPRSSANANVNETRHRR